MIKRSSSLYIHLILRKKNPFFTIELLKGFLIAISIHALFFLVFRIKTHLHDENLLPLVEVAVEIDQKSLELRTTLHHMDLEISLPSKKKLTLPSPSPSIAAFVKEENQFNAYYEADFSALEKIDYSSSLIAFDLPKKYQPVRLFLFSDVLEFSEKSRFLLEKTREKLQSTHVSRFLFQIFVDLSSGKILHYELEEIYGDATRLEKAEALLNKIKFKKGKEKEIVAKIELWLEQPNIVD